ncbi:hypothetical protein JIN85_02835 [Luteolibacter pohnpeiensis]|uniref:Uncharacterized protein n=1 Tax=Luteolibacter pohnpeiensis TaxID=454153 RepID=A0A934VV18_9BACT|nr:DUF6172 family protein [Luteolibacter pohnpeiensis]MBK1881333.1 hypothetical protein [Luteolibacter pohnpeiensis]
MKKLFPLTSPNHQPARVVEQIKADVRKYLKRERRKNLPEGVDFWDFDCRTGQSAESAEAIHVAEITKPIDQAAAENWEAIYIEILAKEGRRRSKGADEKEH